MPFSLVFFDSVEPPADDILQQFSGRPGPETGPVSDHLSDGHQSQSIDLFLDELTLLFCLQLDRLPTCQR